MNILIVGNGGRENALAWRIYNSESFRANKSKMYCTIGSPGIDEFAEPIEVKPTDINTLIDFAVYNNIDLTVVGPEVPLSMGIVDEFVKAGLRVFGPTKGAEEIESSKIYAKELMKKHGVPTAKFKVFSRDNLTSSQEYFETVSYPVVIKADGLAAGKGVIIVNDKEEANDTVRQFTEENLFGESGWSFVVEEFIKGDEVSIFAITDGEDYVILPTSQDHKKISEGETGKNTGGMGAYSPAEKFLDEGLLAEIKEVIIDKVLYALHTDGRKFKGCLYCGLIMDKDRKPYVIEFNGRFGDPETQAVLPLVESDFLELLLASANGTIKDYKLKTLKGHTACVVMASGGYPDSFEKEKTVTGLDEVDSDCLVFHSGTKFGSEGKSVVTAGGRVLSVVAYSKNSLDDAVKKAYDNVDKIHFENEYYRKDIGYKGLK